MGASKQKHHNKVIQMISIVFSESYSSVILASHTEWASNIGTILSVSKKNFCDFCFKQQSGVNDLIKVKLLWNLNNQSLVRCSRLKV